MNDKNNAKVLSISNWLLTNILVMIPFVNIIMLLIWAFAPKINPNKANFARATLILMVLLMILSVVIASLTGIDTSLPKR